jgi:hypothetical protein
VQLPHSPSLDHVVLRVDGARGPIAEGTHAGAQKALRVFSGMEPACHVKPASLLEPIRANKSTFFFRLRARGTCTQTHPGGRRSVCVSTRSLFVSIGYGILW